MVKIVLIFHFQKKSENPQRSRSQIPTPVMVLYRTLSKRFVSKIMNLWELFSLKREQTTLQTTSLTVFALFLRSLNRPHIYWIITMYTAIVALMSILMIFKKSI